MNELTKEAISRELNSDRPLTGRARDYLTRWDGGSECDDLTSKVYIGWDLASGPDQTEYALHNPDGTIHSIDLDEFRKFCEDIGE